MGTNYYAKCNYNTDEFHIGKSSIGWKFLFQTSPYYKDYEGFKKFVHDKVIPGYWKIEDEYGEDVSSHELIELIEWKQKDPRNRSDGADRNGYRFTDRDFS